jgi:hypothetical protein
MMAKLAAWLQRGLKDHHLIWVGLVLALAVLAVPLQLYMPLGRYQHYGLSVFLLGLGYIIQLVWSWPRLRTSPRWGYGMTGIYLISIGLVLYSNPWLDSRVGVMTEGKENLRSAIGWLYTILGLPLVYIYLEWIQDEQDQRKKKGDKN